MRSSPAKKDTKNKTIGILLVVLAVLALAGGAYFFFQPMTKRNTEQADNSVSQTGSIQQQTSTVREEASEIKPPSVEVEEPRLQQEDRKAFESSPPVKKQQPLQQVAPLQTPAALSCNESADKLHQFFQKLNEKEYVRSFSLETEIEEHFLNLTRQLLDNPPVVSRETDDLYTLLTNMAHFFRIIGKDNIILIKTILGRERDQIEDIAHYLYTTLSKAQCARQHYQLSTPVEKMYEYAAFFLNTMGGRSYLFRRESRSRLLVNYYAVLLIKESDRLELNYHGIHLNDYLPFLISEIESSNQLVYKEMYLDNLYSLLEQYQ